AEPFQSALFDLRHLLPDRFVPVSQPDRSPHVHSWDAVGRIRRPAREPVTESPSCLRHGAVRDSISMTGSMWCRKLATLTVQCPLPRKLFVDTPFYNTIIGRQRTQVGASTFASPCTALARFGKAAYTLVGGAVILSSCHFSKERPMGSKETP